MGNVGSNSMNGRQRQRSRQSHPPLPPPPPPAPYDNHHRPPPPASPLPAPYDHHYPPTLFHDNWAGARYPYFMPSPPAPYVEHQKAVTIKNDVNLKKETLRVEPDEEHPGRFLVTFTFDASAAGSITLFFFAKEDTDGDVIQMKESLYAPVTVHFQQGLGQKFRQPSGTGIDFSASEDTELIKVSEIDVYPLVVKAETSQSGESGSADGIPATGTTNFQITRAIFEKERGEYQARVLNQILWYGGMRYELQDILGIGTSVKSDLDLEGNGPGEECVICNSARPDTTVLPCRHMCMCSGCAKVIRFQTNMCPVCKQPIERVLEMSFNNGT